MPLKVAINTTSLLSPLTGIGQYTYQLCDQLLKNPAIDPQFFYGKKWSKELRNSPVQGIELKKRYIKRCIPYSYAISDLIKRYKFSELSGNEIDVYHEPNYIPLSYRHKLILTVHDISFIRYPETHPVERIRSLEKFPETLKRADAIITDSEFTAQELKDYYTISSEKLFPIHLGVTNQFHPRNEETIFTCLQRYKLLFNGYILVVGTLEPRKNLQLVLDAYRNLPSKTRCRYPLVVIGMKGWGKDSIYSKHHSMIDTGQLRLLGYVNNTDLPLLYSGARLFLYPSIYEGFGLPPLEAMASGVPVITSDRASLPEVVGHAGIQVNAEDSDKLCDVVKEVLDDKNKSDSMIEQGLKRSKTFTWERCAKSVINIYQNIAYG